MKVIVKEIKRIFDNFFKIDRAVIQYEKFDGSMTDDIVRLNFDRGHSVAVLLVNLQKQTVILTRQFRFPAYIADLQNPWLLEIIAGMQEDEADPEKIARKEVFEEVGYVVENLQLIYTILPSPGGTSEKVFLYYAEVTADQKKGPGGGLTGEGEDILILELPINEAISLLNSGNIQDAKTIIALQWLKEKINN